jgi:hypothetical protein
MFTLNDNPNNQEIFRKAFHTLGKLKNSIVKLTKESDIFRIMSFNTYKWHNAINEENFIKQLNTIIDINPDIFIVQEATWSNDFENDENIRKIIDSGYHYYIYSILLVII